MSKDLVSIPLPDLKPFPGSIIEPQMEWMKGCDGSQLACRVWPGQPGLPVVVYLHGIEGHSQWFENTGSALNRRGITVYAPDRRGSGLNSRDRGHMVSYKVLLADIEIILRTVAAQHIGQAIVLIGNCWGGKPASVLASENYKTTDGGQLPVLSGLVLICPAIHTKVDFDWQTKLEIGYCSFKGGRYPLKLLSIPLEPYMFTNNPAYLEFIKKDPLRLLEATTKFYFEQFLLTQRAKRTAANLKLPILLVQSGNDEIVNLTALDQWYANVKSKNKSIRMFPDAAHSIDFDPHWFGEYSQLLSDWILERSPGAVA